jgi:hypothetical protein
MTIFERIIESEEIKNDLFNTFDHSDWVDCDFAEDISNLRINEEFNNKEIT